MAAPLIGPLGQDKPASATTTELYMVPPGRRTVLSTIVVAETAGSLATFRVHACIGSASPDESNAIFFDTEIDAGQHYGVTEGITLAAGDKVYGRSDTGAVTFTLFGEETDVPA